VAGGGVAELLPLGDQPPSGAGSRAQSSSSVSLWKSGASTRPPAVMFSTCLYCHTGLGTNQEIELFPVGRRLAFDPKRGRLWVVCTRCGKWNLAPLDERWEAIEECERRFRGTPLRVSTENIALAELRDGSQLVRIGPPAADIEIAAWRYGERLLRRAATHMSRGRAAVRPIARVLGALAIRAAGRAFGEVEPGYDALTWMRIHMQSNRVLDVIGSGRERILIRAMHLESAELLRPDRLQPWRVQIRVDGHTLDLTGDSGLRTAGKLFAAMNGNGASIVDVRYALAKLEDAGRPDGYFARVAALALRTKWGKDPEAPRNLPVAVLSASLAERVALHLTNRSFLGRGGIGSEPATRLPLLPLVDRLALEMAANEDIERRAMEGELADLEAAWRDAEQIASIADDMFERVRLQGPRRVPPPRTMPNVRKLGAQSR
jgi:hypothetical protein